MMLEDAELATLVAGTEEVAIAARAAVDATAVGGATLTDQAVIGGLALALVRAGICADAGFGGLLSAVGAAWRQERKARGVARRPLRGNGHG